MPATREQLQSSAAALCNDFATQAPLDTLLSHFSTTHQVSAKEHGLQLLAPFLGRTFTGRTGLEEYFGLLQKYLVYENMSFGEWVVDAEARKVNVRGKARFEWIEGVGKGQWWDEEFVYVLDFDDEAKITNYQVWADSGAAYLARTGKLRDLCKGPEKKE
ncbi:hypothetical protein BDY19DRAFT_603036 [Irpex rosettiformis]|uniref:Uncharacterized protein n=1 Tax=Irpex rosettiformis TaxID=378272 RepID=A0ACB8TPH2_9APHY|nr:hypothetical protein BDY19DRAFT_603036 [Irpex rosettiformis]